MDDTANKNDKENYHYSEFDDEDTCDEEDNFSDDDAFRDEIKSEHTKEKKTKKKREKGPPIVCLMCKTVWTKSNRGGRLFMFGGSRPFMAKFEAKLRALMGQEDLLALQNKSATKFGRSYICRECYLLVRQTYDNIRRLQRDVSKSIHRIKSVKGNMSPPKDEADSGSDKDLEINYHAYNIQKKKLPPLAERIAEKIAHLTLVKINTKVPVILLEAIDNVKDNKLQVTYSLTKSRNSQNMLNNPCSIASSESNSCDNVNAHMENELQERRNDAHEVNDLETHYLTENNHLQPEGINAIINYQQAARTHTENFYSSKEATEYSAISLNMETSFASQHLVYNGTSLETSSIAASSVENSSQLKMETVLQHPDNQDSSSSDRLPKSKLSQEELAEVLSNPLLLIKSPQPIKLAEVKNDNVYICGEDGCEWIFSSKFFWENHIRHYHRSGRPFICPFVGCERSFTGKSKLELHVRSHTDERPFICDKCGSGFRGNQELRAHRLTHTSEKPHRCLKCDKNFKLLSSLKRHLQFHDGGEFPFPCTYPECKKAFKNRYDLKCHNRLHTGEKPYKCPEPSCGMAFRIPCQFTMHKRTHTGEKPFRCIEEGCCAAYISSNALQAHMLSHTSERPFCCEFCGKTFKHKMLYRMHLKKHSGSQSFLCPVENCGEEYADRRTMDQHMISNHGLQSDKQQHKREFVCTEVDCGLKYSTDGGLRYHNLKVHKKGSAVCKEEADSRILTCPYDKCQREYNNPHNLQDHLDRAHRPLPREKMCQICGQAFPYMEQLEQHIQSLHDESCIRSEQMKGVFVCNSERCGVHFRNLEDRKHHVTWHLGNPPYRCEFEECERTFLLEMVFARHVTEHENNKPVTCSFDHCNEGFTSHIKVLKHSKIHYGFFRCPIDGCSKVLQTLSSARMHLQCHEKPYVCTACGKRFTTCLQLTKHKRSHTGEKVYECKVCSSQFEDCESFKEHKRIHKGEKQHMCDECGQRFSSQVSYKHHMKIHSRELPLSCPEEGCGKAFSDTISLKAHKHMHSKPSNLCTQCGKVYKFSVSKHRCKLETNEFRSSPQRQILQHIEATSSSSLPPAGPVAIQPQPAQQLPQTILHSIPLSLHQAVPKSVAQSMAQSLPQSVSHPLTQSLPQSVCHPLTQSLPQLVSQPMIQSLSQPVSQSLTQSLPISLTQSLPQLVSHSLTQSLPQHVSQSMTQSLPQPISHPLTQSLPQLVSHSLTQALPQPVSQSMTQSLPQPVSHPLTQSLPQLVSHSLTQSLPQLVSQPLTQSLPQPVSQSMAQSLPQPVSQPLSQTLSYPVSQSLTQSLSHLVSQPLTHSLPQPLRQSLPQSVSQPLSQSLPQTLSQSVTQPLPQTLSQNVTSSLPQILSHNLPQFQHQPLPQTLSQTLTPSHPRTLSQTLTSSLPSTLSQTSSHSLPQILSHSLSQSITQILPQSITQSMSTSMSQSLPQTSSQSLIQHQPSQQYMNNMMVSELQPQSYVMEVEEAARVMRHNFGAPDSIVVDPPYYNYIILYDRPIQQ